MAARKTAAARWAAHGGRGVESRKGQPGFGHGIQVGRLNNPATIEADIAPTEIIGHHQDYIGPVLGIGGVARNEACKRDYQSVHHGRGFPSGIVAYG